MEILPEPKDNNDDSFELPHDQLLEFLKLLMGEDGLTFLNLDNAITAVKQAQLFWQAPFAIGLWALPLLYHFETDSQGKHEFLYRFPKDIDSQNKEMLLTSVSMVFGLSFQIHPKNKGELVSDLVDSALEALESRHNSLSAEVPGYVLTDQQTHMLFHIRFALGILLLVKGDTERAKLILREMAATKTKRRGPTWSPEGLDYLDVGETKALAVTVLHGFYAERQDYNMALYLLTEALASNALGFYSESLLVFTQSLLVSFAEKCERENDFGDWVDLFDRATKITEICGEADVSGELPSSCKETSPQFMAWKFGQIVARFAIRNRSSLGDSKKIVPNGHQDHGAGENSMLGFEYGGYGGDWLNGTAVASLLLEYNEHRNWQILRQQYVSMWEALPRYQWLSLCEVGTQTDLYWGMRIGFADQMLTTTEKMSVIQHQTEPSTIVRDIQTTKDIASTIALRQVKQQVDSDKMFELLQKLIERQPPTQQEIKHQLQQRLSSVWSKLPAIVVDNLIEAEKYNKTGVNTGEAKGWFHKAVEASLQCCVVEPLVSFIQKRNNKTIAIPFPPPRGAEPKNSGALRKLSLWEWSIVFEVLSMPVDKSLASLGAEDIRRFMKENFGELPLPALRELSGTLRDFCQRKDSQHQHVPRYEEEIQELEQMRELALGIRRPSVITQIFQLFATGR
jgi:hypothetical protein